MSGAVKMLAGNRDLLLAITEFNYYPNRYVHRSWIERLEKGDIIAGLLHDPMSEEQLADSLLQRFRLRERLCFDFDSPLRMLLLRPRDDILRLLMHVGALLNNRLARHAVLRADVLRWRAGFGPRLFDFARNEAPLMFDIESLPGVAPPREGADVQAHLLASGLWCLGGALRGEEQAIVERFFLKMSTAEYPLLERQPKTFGKRICTAVVEKLARRKLPPLPAMRDAA